MHAYRARGCLTTSAKRKKKGNAKCKTSVVLWKLQATSSIESTRGCHHSLRSEHMLSMQHWNTALGRACNGTKPKFRCLAKRTVQSSKAQTIQKQKSTTNKYICSIHDEWWKKKESFSDSVVSQYHSKKTNMLPKMPPVITRKVGNLQDILKS